MDAVEIHSCCLVYSNVNWLASTMSLVKGKKIPEIDLQIICVVDEKFQVEKEMFTLICHKVNQVQKAI